MKQIDLHTGGHRRSNDDLIHLQNAFVEVFRAILQPLHVGVVTAVWFSGGTLSTASPTTVNLSEGYLATSGSSAEMYYVQAATGLDVSGGKKVFLTEAVNNGTPVVYADGTAKLVHKDKFLVAYTAPTKVNPADIDYNQDTARYGDWLAKAINFDGSNYLNVQQDDWHIVNQPGEPNINTNFTVSAIVGQELKFKKSQTNSISIQGLAICITSTVSHVFTLPAGYRPTGQLIIPAIASDFFPAGTYRPAYIIISENGQVFVYDQNTHQSVTNEVYYINVNFIL